MATVTIDIPGVDISKPCLMSLPPEITERHLSLLDPVDVAAFAQTCRANRKIVYECYDQFLWRSLFCGLFDDPRAEGVDLSLWQRECKDNRWRTQVMDRIGARQRVRAITASPDYTLSINEDGANVIATDSSPASDPKVVATILETLLDLLETSRTRPRAPGESDVDFQSKNLVFLESLLSSEKMRLLLLQCDTTPELRAAAAKLHVHYGLADDDLISFRGRGMARERVYLLASYSPRNRWGPYLPDFSRRPSWEHLEAMLMVLGRNVEEKRVDWVLPPEDVPLMGLKYTQPYSSAPVPPSEAVEGDWAGVNGKWYRVVCFMDYRDLWQFNFGGFGRGSGQTLDAYNEAVRLMSLELRVVAVGEAPRDFGIRGATVQTPPAISALTLQNPSPLSSPIPGSFFPPSALSSSPSSDSSGMSPGSSSSSSSGGSPGSAFHTRSNSDTSASTGATSAYSAEAERYPTIWFTGTVKSPDIWHPTSFVHGRVERGADGSVLWKLTSNYDGEDRWVSEGVQVGGVQSRMGVLGIWSDVEHAHQGPAGPFWFWKAQV